MAGWADVLGHTSAGFGDQPAKASLELLRRVKSSSSQWIESRSKHARRRALGADAGIHCPEERIKAPVLQLATFHVLVDLIDDGASLLFRARNFLAFSTIFTITNVRSLVLARAELLLGIGRSYNPRSNLSISGVSIVEASVTTIATREAFTMPYRSLILSFKLFILAST